MTIGNGKCNVAVLGTSLPRICGLATFTQDLITEIAQMKDFNPPRIIAVNDQGRTYAYGKQVMGQIDHHNRLDYTESAEKLNYSNIDLLVIQHEFGIYGGENGEYVLDLVENLKVPFIVIFHTVLTAPTPKQRHIINRLAHLSLKAVTMAQNTVDDLTSIYAIDPAKIAVINHGVPFVQTEPREILKQRYGFENRQIISTFGFLSPGKGIEYGIKAMGQIVKRHPGAHYIVWGQTHPIVKQRNGEVYRQQLTALVSKLGLDSNVEFVDRMLTQEEVIQSLVLSDIYMTPYLGRDQAVSGTLAYGIGYGRVIVSTPYRYATEMLAHGRGLLADFRDANSLATQILELLENPRKKADMEARTLALGRTMMWSEIAKRYAVLFHESVRANHYSGHVV
ncbi:MAG: glycosyltransferase family 4 protein [Bacilli bacterium]